MLPADDRKLLTSMLRSTIIPAGLARRARVILALADGESYESIATTHGVTDAFVAHWKRRFVEGGLLALAICRSERPDRVDPKVEAKILARTREAPPAPFTHWSDRAWPRSSGSVT